MRSAFVIAAIVLAACTVPPVEQKPIPVSPTIDITESREKPEPPKMKEHKTQSPKVAPAPSASPASSVHLCAEIEADDLKDKIKAKLDCLKEVAK
jgi:hypothetical protein